jgi:hypothetical protein
MSKEIHRELCIIPTRSLKSLRSNLVTCLYFMGSPEKSRCCALRKLRWSNDNGEAIFNKAHVGCLELLCAEAAHRISTAMQRGLAGRGYLLFPYYLNFDMIFRGKRRNGCIFFCQEIYN